MKVVKYIFSNRSSVFLYPLTLLSFFYRFIMLVRAMLYKTIISPGRIDCFVISVGNLTAGGTGKTPMVIFIGKILSSMGRQVAVSSRGYGRKNPDSELLVADGTQLLTTPEFAGEEPFLIAQKLQSVPVVVSSKRLEASRHLLKFGPDVILLDDAFQHLKIARDVNFLLIDATNPFGNRHLLPRGPLREPVCAIKRASAVIITRVEQVSSGDIERVCEEIKGLFPDIPILKARFSPISIVEYKTGKNLPLSFISGKRIVAFAGIGNPESFEKDLKGLGAEILLFKVFKDHYIYKNSDIEELRERAMQAGALIITTEKDAVKIEESLKKELLALENGVATIDEVEVFSQLLQI